MTKKRIFYGGLLLIFLLIITALSVATFGYFLGDVSTAQYSETATENDAHAQIARGAYLALAGNCAGCHTKLGGAPYAGGRMIQTEFGNFVSPNITSDKTTGIGSWTADDFWRALHNGKSKDGHLLYPAFPYPNYTRITRADADAMFRYFNSVAPVHQINPVHALKFPYNQRILLAFWRAFFFRPEVYQAVQRQSAEWNRGAYLVTGLAHCSACHSSRNAFGANSGNEDFSGGQLATLNWYAPSLVASNEGDLAHWQPAQLHAFLKTGITSNAAALGPMAEVVTDSLQHVSTSDIQAIGVYLQALPQKKIAKQDLLDKAIAPQLISKAEMARIMSNGASLYKTHCSDCHALDGSGVASVYPPLKENPSVQMTHLANPIKIILAGGFAPATAANPRPYGMPPFGPSLSDDEIALILSYVRNAWGNQASVVSAAEVNRYRSAPLE